MKYRSRWKPGKTTAGKSASLRDTYSPQIGSAQSFDNFSLLSRPLSTKRKSAQMSQSVTPRSWPLKCSSPETDFGRDTTTPSVSSAAMGSTLMRLQAVKDQRNRWHAPLRRKTGMRARGERKPLERASHAPCLA